MSLTNKQELMIMKRKLMLESFEIITRMKMYNEEDKLKARVRKQEIILALIQLNKM